MLPRPAVRAASSWGGLEGDTALVDSRLEACSSTKKTVRSLPSNKACSFSRG